MNYLVELYNTNGDRIDSWRTADAITALTELARWCEQRTVFTFVNASCYYRSVQQWNLEIN